MKNRIYLLCLARYIARHLGNFKPLISAENNFRDRTHYKYILQFVETVFELGFRITPFFMPGFYFVYLSDTSKQKQNLKSKVCNLCFIQLFYL